MHHPLVTQGKEIETPIYDLLNNDVFNLVVVAVSGFWGGIGFLFVVGAYFSVMGIVLAVEDSINPL